MKTAFIFPGLNGLLRRTDRLRFADWPETQHYLKRAEAVIREDFDLDLNLREFLNGSTEEIYHVDNVSFAAVVIVSIQAAVARRLGDVFGPPDWVMGCSLGDLARAVYAGAYQFEDAVSNHIRFTRQIDGIDRIGGNIGVLAPREAPFSSEDFAWFDDIEVDVSKLTPRFLNVGGRFSDLEKIRHRADGKRWNVMKILDYPAHSRYILPYVQKVELAALRVKTAPPRVPMFSSFSLKPLDDQDEIKREFLLSISMPLHWNDAVVKLVRDHGVRRFINIGPCRSLSGLMKDIPVEVETLEASDLLK